MNPAYVIGITGGSASGKTYLLKKLREKFPEKDVCILSQDDYYKPLEMQQRDSNGFMNFDLPGAIDSELFLHDLLAISKGATVRRKEYLFNHPEKEPQWREFSYAPVIIAEGLFLFHDHLLNELMNLKVFLDTPEEVQYQRRLKRDIEERAVREDVVIYQWHNHVIPAYNNYLLPYKGYADMILSHGNFEEGLETLCKLISNKLSGE